MAAGVSKRKTSKGLGASYGISLAHCSEMCSWDNDEGLESFRNTLSDKNPDRLYIWESTARGFNQWYEMWGVARQDPMHCRCIFLGWWSKDSQRIDREDKDWALYGDTFPPTKDEQRKIDLVKETYGVEVTMEQLAWVRRKYDPSARQEGDAPPEFQASTTRIQEQPWLEEEAFQQTGAVFFANEKLKDQVDKWVSPAFNTYMFSTGTEFVDMRVFKAENTKSMELKVWEEPQPEAVYVMGVDPAFGEDETNDRSAIQVLRCYADGCDQVAEYAYSMVNTRQLAWVVAALLGWYGDKPLSEIRYILELNGPGTAVFNELRSLKYQVDNGYAPLEEQGLKNVFRNVKTYLYSRPDSLGPGFNWHFKCLATTTPIPTPDGWKLLEDVKVGDILFSDLGQLCNVTGASEVYLNRECYRLQLDDGSELVADADHLWEVHGARKAWDAAPRIVRTVDINPRQDVIAVANPLQLPAKELPIDPYVLGVWLGDGYSAAGRFCAGEKDFFELSANLEACGAKLGPVGVGRTIHYRNVIGLIGYLRSLNLLNNKHVPAIYLRASYSQRLALLQGLMDTDGSINAANRRQASFTTTSPQLAIGFSELIRSLGIKAKCLLKQPYITGVKTANCTEAYQFWFTTYPEVEVFRLKRKLDKIAYAGKVRHRISRRHKIVSMERVPSVPVKCLQVDSPSHLFLAGPAMIPTHNTTGPLKVTIMERLRDFVSNGQMRIKSADVIKEMSTVAREGDVIKAPGQLKDDRVLALALALHCWEGSTRKQLIVQRRTREAEAAKRNRSVVDQVRLFNGNMMEGFFKQKSAVRQMERQLAMRMAWRGRR